MRIGDFIETYNGIQFYPLDPKPEEIHIVDIAHSLSNLCRYGGHSKIFYSVAQHSINMVNYLKTQTDDPKILLDAALHDASEAYLLDIPRPLKKFLYEYKNYENKLQKVIYTKYGLDSKISSIVKQADDDILSYEASILMSCYTWNENPIDLSHIVKIEERKNSEVKEEYLTILRELIKNVK